MAALEEEEGIITQESRRRSVVRTIDGVKGTPPPLTDPTRRRRKLTRGGDNLAKMIFLAPMPTTTAMVALIWHFRFRSWEGEIDERETNKLLVTGPIW